MIGFLIGKAMRTVLALLIIVTLTFIVLRLAGDPAQTFLPPDTSPQAVEVFRVKWGLDRPLHEQYIAYLGNVVTGDLGHSFVDGRPAAVVVGERIPKTLLLLGTSFLLMLVMGMPLGIVSALKHDSWIDRTVMAVTVLGYSLPNFFLGILLILFFSMRLRWLPSTGSDSWQNLIMPAITIGTAGAAVIARFVRTAMLEVLSKPYVRAARARGLLEFAVVTRHAMPNAAIPTVTVIGFLLGSLIAGAVVTEAVFAWPGIGRLTVTSVSTRDLAVVQAIVLLIAATMVAANLAVDLVYGWLDPRIRDGARGGRS